MLRYMSEYANTRKHVSEHSWSFGWVILSILAHLAHMAQSYFSLIFSAFNTDNCYWFNQTNKKNYSDWRRKNGEKWQMLATFFLTAIAAITGGNNNNNKNNNDNSNLPASAPCSDTNCDVSAKLALKFFFVRLATAKMKC